MDPKFQFLFYLVALLLFLAAFVKDWAASKGRPVGGFWRGSSVGLVGLGLASAIFPFLWGAAVAGW